MIKHIVFFKFKPEASESARREVLDELRALPDKIDVIRTFEVGEDVLRASRSWDAALVAVFDDLGALDVYTRHDDHVAVVMKLRPLSEAAASVDFEF
jgi:hypothetical protein